MDFAHPTPVALATLAKLAERMARIEGRAVEYAGASCSPDSRCVPTGWTSIDTALGGGIPRRGVHEWWHIEDSPGARTAPVDVLIHLAWQALLHDERHSPDAARCVVWVGRAVWPHAQALVRGLRVGARAMFGAPCPRLWPDARLVDRSLLVDTGGDTSARLWATEQAARCTGVCAVIADGAGFDLPATRRLQLAASNVLLLLARPRERHSTLSACSTRWRVRCAEQGDALANGAPPEPTWIVELERAKGLTGGIFAAGIHARMTRSWELDGVDAPPSTLVAEAVRRRRARSACYRRTTTVTGVAGLGVVAEAAAPVEPSEFTGT